jgi:hypothetical protein
MYKVHVERGPLVAETSASLLLLAYRHQAQALADRLSSSCKPANCVAQAALLSCKSSNNALHGCMVLECKDLRKLNFLSLYRIVHICACMYAQSKVKGPRT